MKLIVLTVVALAAVALAAPVDQVPPRILRSDIEQKLDGSYVYNVETEDGIKKDETGEIKNVVDEENKPQTIITVRGSYSWVDPDNQQHVVNYFADETGFHAESADLPKTRLA